MELSLKRELKDLLKSQPLPYWQIAVIIDKNGLNLTDVIQKTGSLKTTIYYIWNTYSLFSTKDGRRNDDLKWLEKNGYRWSVIKQIDRCKNTTQYSRVIKALKKEKPTLSVKAVNKLIKAAAIGGIQRGMKANKESARFELEIQYEILQKTPFSKLSNKQLKEMRQCISKYLDLSE